MISPFTRPGTRVEVVGVPKQVVKSETRFLGFTLRTVKRIVERAEFAGMKLTVSNIERDADFVTGYGARVYELPKVVFFLSLLRTLDLPECLTSLLHTQPHDLDARVLETKCAGADTGAAANSGASHSSGGAL